MVWNRSWAVGQRLDSQDSLRGLRSGAVTKGEKFRLSQPTCGVIFLERQIIVIPTDSVIQVVTVRQDNHQMVEVDWNGATLRLFARDIQDRGIQVKPPDAISSNSEERQIA